MFIVYDFNVIIIANRSNQNSIQVLYLKLYEIMQLVDSKWLCTKIGNITQKAT